MAKTKQKKTDEGIEFIENTDAIASKTEEFFNEKKNQNLLLGIGAVIAILVAGFVFYRSYLEDRNTEAQEEMFQAIYYFEADSLGKALNGDGNNYGFLDIVDLYSGTDAANLANFYIGSSYLGLGQFDNATRYFEEFSSSDILIQARAYALTGDAYMELGDFESAISNYEKAVNHKPNKEYTPIYLQKLAIAQEENGNLNAAAEAYGKIVDEYPNSKFIQDAQKHKARLEGLLAE